MNADVDKISEQCDLRQLESLLQNITYANLDRDDMERLGDENFIKLFRLSQMSIEYLMYTQNYLECLTRTLDLQYKNSHEQTKDIREKTQRYNTELFNLKKENQIKSKTLATYEYLIKIPKEGDTSQAMKCSHCQKFFASEQYLRKHYQKRHPDANYDAEYPNKSAIAKQTDKSQAEMLEKQKKEQEKLFTNMKTDIVTNLNSSIGNLEKELNQIKNQQGKLEGLRAGSENEQKRLESQLEDSKRLLRDYKSQWALELEKHQLNVSK